MPQPDEEKLDPTLELAVFGKQVEEFLQSDVGSYLINRAKEEALEAMEVLKTVHPWRHRRIQELQKGS